MPAALRSHPRFDDWLEIDADGRIHVLTGKVEFGQGIRTAIGQLVADELAVPVDQVEVEAVDTDRSPDEGVTSGSRSIEESYAIVGRVAAAARMKLVESAAARLEVSADTIQARDGRMVARDGRAVGYAELAARGALRGSVGSRARRVSTADRRAIGRDVPRSDLPGKVLGRAAFVQDLELPGMLHGRIVRPPDPGARLIDLDEAEVRAMPGVRAVVRDGSFVGIVAEREDQAIRALRRARRVARWAEGPPLPRDAGFLLESPSDDVLVTVRGDRAQVGTPARRLQAEYRRPYLAHASLGPSCAIATFRDDGFEIWSQSQGVFHLRQELAKVLGVPRERIRVIHAEGAGCYGANGADDAALDAALLARAVPESPVRVQWMREDEAAWEPFGTPMIVRIAAALNDRGEVIAWQHDVWGNGHRDRAGPDAPDDVTNLLAARHLAAPFRPTIPPGPSSPGSGGGRNAAPPYDFPVVHVVNHFVAHTPVRVSALRSLGAHANVFAIESFVDEITSALGQDPVAWRLAHLADPRARAVVARVDEMAGSEAATSSDPDRGRGIAFARYKGSGCYVAVVAEVEIGDDLEVTHIWAAVDAGLAINPDGILNQAEGGIIQAASWTLREAVRFDGSTIASTGWESYPILTFATTPAVEVTLLQDPNQPPLGVGEAFAGPTAAAIGNACFAATGIRVREMPFTRDQFLKASA